MNTARDQRIIEAWRTGDDETFVREISLANVESVYRERDEVDVDVPPDSMRGKVLAMYDEMDRVIAAIDAGINAAPWYKRFWMRAVYRLAQWQARRSTRSSSGM